MIQGTRIPLDTVVLDFRAGRSAEEIVLGYPTLDLADVYAVLAYYLRHPEVVDAYVAQRNKEAGDLRACIGSHADHSGIRERLLAQLTPQNP